MLEETKTDAEVIVVFKNILLVSSLYPDTVAFSKVKERVYYIQESIDKSLIKICKTKKYLQISTFPWN